ncbi:KpsF/GutQ family sugar-phosphate isomerase [Labrys wisconsinensis]|uniref:Arabinose-5-phosphate isomerase n=1 Tax=Labrys wisconsinensis TaxID=425677 RepID=A0ABU0J1X8_9HYPH|nr:KpsF/GutQ family sugar-phosphate isomerase [Labrys wisconsinensis]MDQ0468260.1 arabinose-5-phosphate isomerase [Labrys wisconsinensis]
MRRTKSLDPAVASALRSIETERRGLDVLVAALSNGLGDAFAACIARIQAARGRVIVTGMGKSGHVGRKIAATLASTGTPAFFVHPGEASHGDLGMITPDDVVMALSWSGETRELGDLIDYASRFGVTLIAVTCSPDSTLGRAADICLAMPRAEEACPHGLAPTTSALMQLALGDALAVALLEAHGFTASQFRVYHPGGKLGAALKFVRDVMHAGEGMPVVPVGSLMSEAMLVMSSKGLGCVGVIDGEGALLGIVTDGDLRRHMSNDLMARSVDVVMTRRPLTIRPDVLVGEALETMEARKVTALFVVDGLAPLGVVHLHDLLRIGLV